MKPREERDPRLILPFGLGFLVAIGLGYWGWLRVHVHEVAGQTSELAPMTHHFLGRAYLTLQLFVLHPQGLDASVPVQLQIARFLAPIVLATATVFFLARTFGGRARDARVKRSPHHVIICGAGVHGTFLTEILLKKSKPVVLIDISPHAAGLQRRRQPREARLIADTVHEEVLARAGIHRAAELIAVTGDDVVNAQIASSVRSIFERPDKRRRRQLKPEILVQAEDPVLARFLDELAIKEGRQPSDDDAELGGAPRPKLGISTFSANALAATALLGGGPVSGSPHTDEKAPFFTLEKSGKRHLLLAGDHALVEAIVVTALRRGRAQRLLAAQRAAESPDRDDSMSRVELPPLRIVLLGPGSQSRRDTIASRWQLDPAVIDLRAAEVDPSTERALVASRSWSEWQSDVSHALVACEDEQASIGVSVTLSRVLGRSVCVVRVATQPTNELDQQLEEYSRDHERFSEIDVRDITTLAWGDEGERAKDVPPWRQLCAALISEGVRQSIAHKEAIALLSQEGELHLQSDAAPRITPATAPIVAGLLRAAGGSSGAVTPSALVAAGLTPDLTWRHNLLRAATELSRERAPAAFPAWCEYVRLSSVEKQDPGAEGKCLCQLASKAPDGGVPLRLKAAALGADQALHTLTAWPTVAERLQDRDSRRVAIFAGGAARMPADTAKAIRDLLKRALYRYDGLILTGGNAVGVCGAVREAAEEHEVPVIGYAPEGLGTDSMCLRVTPPGDFSTAEPVAMWADLLTPRARSLIGGAENVVLVAFPGGPITETEIILARALGAKVAFLDPREDLFEPLDETLPFGAGGILALPNDPMTLRAFLMWPNKEVDAGLRTDAARELHDQYRREHRRHKPGDDPALLPWERLPAMLQRSNLAAVDDIPNKLHVLGCRLQQGGMPLRLAPDTVELLAEMEHGRYNNERLGAGWELGRTRQVTRMVSPYLTPWSDLDETVRQWDRDAVVAIGGALRVAGWGVTAEPESSVGQDRGVVAGAPDGRVPGG